MAKFEAPGFKVKFRKFRGFAWKMLLERKALLSNNFFHTNLLILFKIQTVINSHSLMMGASNVAILIVFDMLFPFLAFVKL